MDITLVDYNSSITIENFEWATDSGKENKYAFHVRRWSMGSGMARIDIVNVREPGRPGEQYMQTTLVVTTEELDAIIMACQILRSKI